MMSNTEAGDSVAAMARYAPGMTRAPATVKTSEHASEQATKRRVFDAPPLPELLLHRLQPPALIVFLDRVRENIRLVIDLLDGNPNRWRPHLKTTKMPLIWRELIAAGVRNFKCATTREAAV